MAVGDPQNRSEEEMVFVPNSFATMRNAKDWESCTLNPWAMHLPCNAGASDIERLITNDLKLQ
jgi:hypothetical protein